YQSIPANEVTGIVKRNLDEEPFDFDSEIVWCGDGDDLPLADVNEVATALREEIARNPSASGAYLEELEARTAGQLHAAMSSIPTHVLDDPGFWRYLGLGPFWEFVRAREASAFDSREPAKYLHYVDGKRPTECVMLRCYLRGAIAKVGDDYSLAYDPGRATDLWRSHILRVRTGTAPEIARALLRSQRAERMGTEELRGFARRL